MWQKTRLTLVLILSFTCIVTLSKACVGAEARKSRFIKPLPGSELIIIGGSLQSERFYFQKENTEDIGYVVAYNAAFANTEAAAWQRRPIQHLILYEYPKKGKNRDLTVYGTIHIANIEKMIVLDKLSLKDTYDENFIARKNVFLKIHLCVKEAKECFDTIANYFVLIKETNEVMYLEKESRGENLIRMSKE